MYYKTFQICNLWKDLSPKFSVLMKFHLIFFRYDRNLLLHMNIEVTNPSK